MRHIRAKMRIDAPLLRAQIKRVRARLAAVLVCALLPAPTLLAAYPDRFVWIFGWGLGQDSDVTNVTRVLDSAAQHNLDGAGGSFGLDTLCKHDEGYFRRL